MLIRSVRFFLVEDVLAYSVLDRMTLKVPSDPTQSEFRILQNIFSILLFPPRSIWRLKPSPPPVMLWVKLSSPGAWWGWFTWQFRASRMQRAARWWGGCSSAQQGVQLQVVPSVCKCRVLCVTCAEPRALVGPATAGGSGVGSQGHSGCHHLQGKGLGQLLRFWQPGKYPPCSFFVHCRG